MHGPLFHTLAKSRLRVRLRQRGYGFREINDVLTGLDQDTIDAAGEMVTAKTGLAVPEAEMGGPVLDWITRFLDSEFGKALIDMLLKLLLGLI